MPKEIRTKASAKDIKVLDKAANVGQRMKNAAIRSKSAVRSADGAAESTQQPGYDNPANYATDHMENGAKDISQGTVRRLKNPHKKAAENVNRAQEQFKRARQQLPKTRMAGRQTIQTAKQSARAGKQAGQTIRTSVKTAKATAKGTVKTVKKSVKTAERTARTTVKMVQKTAKAAQQSAKAAAKAAKVAAQASRAAAKAAAQAAKVAVKALAGMVKAAIAATKGLVALIAAGGWVAVVIILVICMIGLLIGSIFGIFFSGEDSGSGYTMPMAIQEINQEYADKLTEIRNGNSHDDVKMSGTRAEWKEVLAAYAVKTSTDPDKAQDVATMDESKKALLSSVFWDMNVLAHYTETREVTEVTVEGDGEGFVATETTVTKTILYIAVSHKTAEEMAEQYGFSAQQKAQLAELLSDQYADLWSALLYGIHNGSDDIVAVAISQIGNVDGEPYWSWYGFDSRVAWCACFVSWCANECGYIEAGLLPQFASCEWQGIPWFQERGQWQPNDGSYTPSPGDIIFFDWELDGKSDHVGIVEYVEGEYVHTIEGNTSNSCARRSYRLDSGSIVGYGVPEY